MIPILLLYPGEIDETDYDAAVERQIANAYALQPGDQVAVVEEPEKVFTFIMHNLNEKAYTESDVPPYALLSGPDGLLYAICVWAPVLIDRVPPAPSPTGCSFSPVNKEKSCTP